MDYLNLKKERRHTATLFVGYLFVIVAITIGSLVLLYQARGYGIGKNGAVIQNGLVFVSSQPNPAQIYINGAHSKYSTNTRITLPAAIYTLDLKRAGYDDWQRQIEVDGGDVRHFDYPFLIPSDLKSTKLASYSAAPSVVSQSLDRHWLLVGHGDDLATFDLYDLTNPTKAPTTVSLPSTILSAGTTQSLQVVQWADDNQHVLIQHTYDGKVEFILLDRVNPDQSINLNTTLDLDAAPTKLTLNNEKYDQYYLYNSAAATLDTATLKAPTVTPLLGHVLSYATYNSNIVLYVTDSGAASGKTLLKLMDGSQTYSLHTFSDSSNYLLDLTTYSGVLYVAAGATDENKVYIYPNPIGQLSQSGIKDVSPVQVLHVPNANYISFSNNAQFIMAESGSQFAVYDISNQNGYNFLATDSVEAPQAHATWMDGDRLTYVSNDALHIVDYDDTNGHQLLSASPNYEPSFAADYHYVYYMKAVTSGGYELTQLPLLTPADI